jgi:hypothetical protein
MPSTWMPRAARQDVDRGVECRREQHPLALRPRWARLIL